MPLDQLTTKFAETAAETALNSLMARKKPGTPRAVYVLVVIADGNDAAKVHAYTAMPNAVAMQFADSVEHEADSMRTSAQAGAMATGQAIAISRKARLKGG